MRKLNSNQVFLPQNSVQDSSHGLKVRPIKSLRPMKSMVKSQSVKPGRVELRTVLKQSKNI